MSAGNRTTQMTTETGAGFDLPERESGLLRAWAPPAATSADRARVGPAGLIIGREAAASWQILDPRLSKVHARVTRGSAGLLAEDLGSTNGTFLNGRPLAPGRTEPLVAGSLLRAGNCLLVATDDVAPAMEPLSEVARDVGLVGHFHAPGLAMRLRRLAAVGQHVLLAGESGAGKELAAQVLARESQRLGHTDGRLLAFNCARFASEEEATASLFGIRAGVFTGVTARRGLLEEAAGGVLFLDEVHALPPRVQQGLLRFVEDHGLSRVGDAATREARILLVFATNLALAAAVQEGFLAFDLVGRLQALEVPSLETRRADVPEIFGHVLRRALERRGVTADQLAGALHPDQLETICLLPFRHRNVRELIQLAELFAASVALREHSPRHALGALLAERYPDHPVVNRARRGASGRGEVEPGSPKGGWSLYERNKEAILQVWRASGRNLSATERALKEQGIKASRRWLREYLARWGERN